MAVAMLDDVFELRILSGLHKGARAVLPAGDTVVIGSDAACDFILRDRAMPARLLQLQQQGGAWMLQWLTASGDADASRRVLLPKDKAVSLAAQNGGSDHNIPVLAVQPAHLPWPKVLPALIGRVFQNEAASATDGVNVQSVATASQEHAGEAASVAAVAAGTASGSQTLLQDPPGGPEPVVSALGYPASLARVLLKKPGQLIVTLLLVLTAVALLVYLASGWFRQISGMESAVNPSGLPALAAGRMPGADPSSLDASRAAITAIATNLQLLSRTRIEVAENGQRGLLVRAGPLTDAETEAFSAALSRLSPRPGLRVVSEFSLREAVQESVARQSTARSSVLTAVPLALGRFQIQGRLPENADRDALLAELRTEFAGSAVFESAVQTSADSAARMVEELQKTGIASVQGQWQAGKLLLQAQMPKASLPLWEASLSRIAARYALPFTATLSWTANTLDTVAASAKGQANANANPRRQPGLPFALQSIVGGPTPYVVTADGGKLLPGGSYQGWKLVDISAQRVVFEAVQGAKRVEVRR